MPKMKCRCDYVFRFNGNAEDYEQCLLPMKFIFDVTDDLEKGSLTSDEFSDRCLMNWRNVHPCPTCGRVYIETKPGSDVFECYVKEEPPS
jgi:hypothetical protein